MVVDIITIFPELFPPYLNESLLKRAQKKGLLGFRVHNLRDWATDGHKTVDDRPYGGGPGMVLKAEPIIRCLRDIKNSKPETRNPKQSLNTTVHLKNTFHRHSELVSESSMANVRDFLKTLNQVQGDESISETGSKYKILNTRAIVLDPAGKQFTQSTAKQLARYDRLILLCGRYEGFDERVYKFVDEKISIGPYVLSGGELPALVLIDAVSRMIHGVVGDPGSIKDETHAYEGYVEYPQYTRPEALSVRGLAIRKSPRSKNLNAKRSTLTPQVLRAPKVLLSGDHRRIAEWRAKHAKSRGR